MATTVLSSTDPTVAPSLLSAPLLSALLGLLIAKAASRTMPPVDLREVCFVRGMSSKQAAIKGSEQKLKTSKLESQTKQSREHFPRPVIRCESWRVTNKHDQIVGV